MRFRSHPWSAHHAAAGLLFATALAMGCSLVADVHDRTLASTVRPGEGGAGASGTGGGGHGSGGLAGGGDGGGGASPCVQGVSCYLGPASTRDVGTCRSGTAICANGALTACDGEVLPSWEVCDDAEDHDCDGAAACQGHVLWSRRFGDASEQELRAGELDSAGNVVIAGVFEGTMDFDGHILSSLGSYDIFVAKLDPNGSALWARQLGDAANQVAQPVRLALDGQDNVYVAGAMVGGFQHGADGFSAVGVDGYVASFAPDGAARWAGLLGGAGVQRVRDLAVDVASGDVLLFGVYAANIDIDGTTHTTAAGVQRLWLARFDPQGNRIWSRDFGSSVSDSSADAITVLPSGAVLVLGNLSGPADLGGGEVPTGSASPSVFLARYDEDGLHLESQAHGLTGASVGRRLAQGPDGRLYVVGLLQDGGTASFGGGTLAGQSSSTAFAVRIDEDGSVGASRLFEEIENAGSVGNSQGGYVALGMRYQAETDLGLGLVTHAGGTDAAMLKLTADLDPVWIQVAGDLGDEDVKLSALDGLGRMVVGGSFAGTITVDGTSLTATGAGRDVFVARFAP